MKKLILLVSIIALFGLYSCENQDSKISTDLVNNSKTADGEAETGELPAFTFEKTEHDFGKIIQGEKVTYSFKFENTGRTALLISKVSSSCGCTVSKYPKKPIQPGEVEYIVATFDSNHKKGIQNKTITILANTEPNRTVLRVKTQVILPQKN